MKPSRETREIKTVKKRTLFLGSKGKQRVVRVEDNIRAREVEGGCTMGRIPMGKPVLLSMETRYSFALYSIKTVDRSCSRKCANGMIHCRGRESVSLFSSSLVFPREKHERRDYIVKNVQFMRVWPIF